jgi:hypothetical protein
MKLEQDKVISNTMERHTQTALVLLLVALLLWVGGTTQSTAVSVAEMRVEVAYLKAAIERPDSDIVSVNLSIADMRARLLILEEKTASTNQE